MHRTGPALKFSGPHMPAVSRWRNSGEVGESSHLETGGPVEARTAGFEEGT